MNAANPQTVSAATATGQLQTAADALANRIGQLSAAAKSGTLRIDPAAGKALHTALLEQLDRIDEWVKTGQNLQAPLPLGSQWLGERMSMKFSVRAFGADVSLLTVLGQYREIVSDAAQAIASTMSGYTATEEHNSQALKATPGAEA